MIMNREESNQGLHRAEKTDNGVFVKPGPFGQPGPFGRIDDSLNQLQQDDPDLIKAVMDRLILPPDKPFQWGSRVHTGWSNKNCNILPPVWEIK